MVGHGYRAEGMTLELRAARSLQEALINCQESPNVTLRALRTVCQGPGLLIGCLNL